MAVSESSLIINREKAVLSNRLLGIIGIIGAPMLMAQALCLDFAKDAQNLTETFFAFLGVLYIGGWICGAIGMYRQKVYGATKASKIIFAIQMIFLTLALLFSVQETFRISYENGGTFFAVCDAGYPLSHLFMNVVGIFVWRAKVWQGFPRFAAFLVGAALPLTLALMPFFGERIGFFSFCGLTTIGLGTIGWKILKNKIALRYSLNSKRLMRSFHLITQPFQ